MVNIVTYFPNSSVKVTSETLNNISVLELPPVTVSTSNKVETRPIELPSMTYSIAIHNRIRYWMIEYFCQINIH